jgi:hypothetical protein
MLIHLIDYEDIWFVVLNRNDLIFKEILYSMVCIFQV